MTLNNRTFTLLKIVLLIIISIFIAEIIVLPKIEHDMLQEAGRQELVTVQQICGAVLENYPDVEQDFILGLRQPTNSLQEKGEQILKQYGYDEEHLLADNTLYAAYMIAWRNWTGFFLVTTFLLLAAALLYFYSTIRSSNKEILLILEQYLSEDFSFAYGTERIVKGRIHFMSNQIGDRLKQLGHQIVTKNTRITEEKESTKALVTDISHQLKTPMAALKTCFYMYLDASDADEKTEFLKRSETQLEKLEQLIASLMNISRLETAMISLTKESILLSDLLVDAVNGVYEKARRKSIEISVQETENITLHLDKHWTSEAVINVLDNAVKYSPRNSHVTISIEKQHFYTKFMFKSYDEELGIAKQLIRTIQYTIYGLLIVIGIIGYISLINTMITSILVRKKELGILQAIGLSDKQLRQMIHREGMFFTFGTLVLSLTIGNGLGYLLVRIIINTQILTISQYEYPITQTLVLTVAVVIGQIAITVFVNRYIHKQSLVERMRD